MDENRETGTAPDNASLETAASAQALATFIYDRTAQSKVSGAKWIRAQRPSGVREDLIASLLATSGQKSPETAMGNIAVVKGAKDRYYYDATIMTEHFARLDALIEDKDILTTIATVTRSDCRLYPRPTEFSKMTAPPFRFTVDEVEGAAARMQFDTRFEDIGVVQASNGMKAFYSSRHMSETYARALLEESEVESKMWP